jgi:hypothetical protein
MGESMIPNSAQPALTALADGSMRDPEKKRIYRDLRPIALSLLTTEYVNISDMAIEGVRPNNLKIALERAAAIGLCTLCRDPDVRAKGYGRALYMAKITDLGDECVKTGVMPGRDALKPADIQVEKPKSSYQPDKPAMEGFDWLKQYCLTRLWKSEGVAQ